jgi:hypothetical protein
VPHRSTGQRPPPPRPIAATKRGLNGPAGRLRPICALLSALGTNLAFLFKLKDAVAAPDVDMRHPLRSALDLFRSRWWSIGWAVAAVAFALHVAALTLAPISIGQAVLAEHFFGFELGRRQWIGIGLVAVSLSLLALTAGGGAGAHSALDGYPLD